MDGDAYIQRYSGNILLAGLCLIGMVVATAFWPSLAIGDAFLAGALAIPLWRWYRAFFNA